MWVCSALVEMFSEVNVYFVVEFSSQVAVFGSALYSNLIGSFSFWGPFP